MGHFSLGPVNCCGIYTLSLAQDPRLFRHVVYSRVLDQLQRCRVCFVGGQSRDHCARLDLWHFYLVAVFFHSNHQLDLDMGIKQKALAYLGGI
jgi:hypothetical protein